MYFFKGLRGEALSHEDTHAVQIFVPNATPIQPVTPALPMVPPSPIVYSAPWYAKKLFGIVPVWLLLLGGAGFVGYKLYKR